MVTTGRNERCPCGSGAKYKRCCGRAGPTTGSRPVGRPTISDEALRNAIFQQQVREAERVRKFGHVRPPIAIDHMGYKVAAVGNKLQYSKRWKTFHDFLPHYLAALLTSEWGNKEIKKPFEERHPILQWYHRLCDLQRQYILEQGKVHVGVMNGPVKAYMALAYDLYTLEHHALLQEHLIRRLKIKEQFQGARYETYVAAAFVRAGFGVYLEDESDSATSHCEFAAKHKATGAQYSIEAKSRHRSGFLGQPGPPKPAGEIEADIYRLLQRSLKKRAEFDRIVFIDINVPPVPGNPLESETVKRVGLQLRQLEETQSVDNPWPRAFVCFTNHPYHYVGAGVPEPGHTVLFTAINNPDYKQPPEGIDPVLLNLGAVLSVRYPAISDLVDSVMNHSDIPHDFG